MEKKITIPKIRAFLVHLFTASGSLFAFFSLVATSEHYWVQSFLWLGIALIVDGLDGPIARRLKVKYVLPTWSGELLDNVIDYVTYVLIPAFILYESGLMESHYALIASVVIVVSSAIYYADTGMKTEENFFKGFPVVWNIVVFSLFVLAPPDWVVFSVVIVSAFISFLPVYFLHPVRVERLRFINLPIFILWFIFSGLAVFYNLQPPLWLKWCLALSGIYLYLIGAVMQFFPQLGRKSSVL